MEYIDTVKINDTENILSVIKNYETTRLVLNNDKQKTQYINQVIDKIYIINLESCKIRRNYITRLFQKYSINAELIIVNSISNKFYSSINNKNLRPGEVGCYLSHMYCLYDSIINNYAKIIIFEDDVFLHKNFCNTFRNIDTKINYEILFLGSSDYNFTRLNSTLINNDTYIPHDDSKKFLGAFSICYTNFAVKQIFNHRITQGYTNFDYYMIKWKKLVNNKLYVCWPNLVIPDLSTTNLDHNFWIDNVFLHNNFIDSCYGTYINWSLYNILYLILFSYINLDNSTTYKQNIENSINKLVNNDIFKKQKILKNIEFDFFNNCDLEYILKI